ncbi:MAG: transketolase [Gammaproteobacteria bacterium]|nr:transketolase [Gammaproteobacteria bacterium]
MNRLIQQATEIALDERSLSLRRQVLRTLAGGGRGHIGSTLSLIEILRVLYDDVLRFDAKNPTWEARDRFILSKGHGCIAQYVMLADKGFIDPNHLDTFCKFDSILGGHPETSKIPGVEASTGSLGHGLSVGFGFALAAQMKQRDNRVFVVMGDGEINEGSVWEAALSIGKHNLSNLTVLIDYNKIQSAGFTKDIQNLDPLADKWKSFNFETAEVNGHDTHALKSLLQSLPFNKNKPSAIICHTVKGKGISFAENDPRWHHKARLSDESIQEMYSALENQ